MACKLISDMPEEILEYILNLLSPYRDLKSAMFVSKQWNRITHGVIRKIRTDFKKAVDSVTLEWVYAPSEAKPTITERYSHSAVYHDKYLYVFGGCTSTNTTFNDLWSYDLASRVWIRPLATGSYPSPKACSSLVVYNDCLILFGGWSHPTPYPLHQAARFYNQLHMYIPNTNRWEHVVGQNTPQGKAGHAAVVIHDMMVLFGGSHGHGLSSNELWVLDLHEIHKLRATWRKEQAVGKKPCPRYGHAMLVLDDYHLLVIGGCGGPNMQFTDVWLLDTSVYPWQWQEITIEDKDNAPPQLWCHTACKVGDKVVVLSKASKPPVPVVPPPVTVKPLLTTQLAQARRAMTDTSESSSQDSSSDTDDVVQRNCRSARLRSMGRSPHHRHAQRAMANAEKQSSNGVGSSTQDGVKQEESMEVDVEICAVCRNDRDTCTCESGFSFGGYRTVVGGRSGGSKSQASGADNFNDSSLFGNASNVAGRLDDSDLSAGSGTQDSGGGGTVGEKVIPFKVPFKASFKGGMPSVRPNASKNRQKQLDTLRMYEEKFRAKMAAAGVDSKDVKVQGHSVEVVSNRRVQNPMYIHTLDISKVISNHTVKWLPLEQNSGTVPEETIFYSLHSGRGELFMFGGIQADITSMQRGMSAEKQIVTNDLYFLKPKLELR